jgi:hypothetical protein
MFDIFVHLTFGGEGGKKEKKAARKSRRRGRKLSRYRQRNEKVSVSLLVAFAVTRRRYEERQIRKKFELEASERFSRFTISEAHINLRFLLICHTQTEE